MDWFLCDVVCLGNFIVYPVEKDNEKELESTGTLSDGTNNKH